jgi:flagellum-specific peptidoglycan hydrolase FlgJ
MYKEITPESKGLKDNAFRLAVLYGLALGVVGLIIVAGLLNETRHQRQKNDVTLTVTTDTSVIDTCMYTRVYKFINEIGMKYPDVVFAKAVLESGHFKSKLFLNKNNLFGMKKAVHRTTLGQGNANDYVYFKSIEESIIDYKLYQMQFIDEVDSQNEYIKRICKSYSTNGNYEKLLLSVMDSLKDKIKWIKTKG